MTSLVTEWINGIETEMQDYNDNLKQKLGINLLEFTAKIFRTSKEAFSYKIQKHTIAVIPITVGDGMLNRFSESVAAIVKAMGCNVFVTNSTDVAGISEGILKGADILFMADENAYISVNVRTGAIGDNNIATAKGYVAALERMAGTLKNKEVLVIGCGSVGRNAIDALKEMGAVINLYDKDMDKLRELNCEGISVITDINEINNYKYVLDASNEGGWLRKEMLSENAVISSPGVPLSFDVDTYDLIRDRVIHDYLQIGTAVMLGLVCKDRSKQI